MNFRFTLPATIVVFVATVFVSEAAAQMRRMGVSAPFGQARISSRFGPRAGFPRARIGFGGFNRGQFFPGSLLYPYFYPPYFYPGYYPDYDYEEYQQNETQASPPQVITVQPAPSPAPAPAASPVQSLVLENQGGQWVRISNFGQPSALAPPTGPDSARAAAKLPPTVLVFRDGHNEEVERYMIQGDVIFIGANYWSTGSWTKKVPIGALDIPATVRLNEERGGKFSLPSGPNEVMLRP
jgi:hypothetical protein